MPRAKQAFITPATEARLARSQLVAEMRTPAFASVIDKLHTLNKLSDGQLHTAKRWASLVSDYSYAQQAPKAPTSCQLDRDHHNGRPADPDSDSGIKEAKRHAYISESYLAAITTLRRHPGLEHVLDAVVINDRPPMSWVELTNLKFALDRLQDHFAERRRARV